MDGPDVRVLVVGGALGARRGFTAVTLYVLLGLIGLPFFAEGKGGSAVILGATGGYIIGFVVAGTIVGRLAELGWDRRFSGAVAMMLIGTVVIYAIGLPWLSYVRHLSVADTISGGLAPFIVVGHREAAGRGGHLPGCLVAHRAATGRSLARSIRLRPRPARRALRVSARPPR